MKINKMKAFIGMAVVALFTGMAITSCDSWTDTKAKDYYENPKAKESFKNDLKDYFASPHKVMFGWFGNWAGKGGSMQYSLMGLPDSVDFVSLWLMLGNHTAQQQADLEEFQARGSRAVYCFTSNYIGKFINNVPGIAEVDADTTLTSAQKTAKRDSINAAYWGYAAGTDSSYIAAAEKYAQAIADSCEKYNVDGFDIDLELTGNLIDMNKRERLNTFMRVLRREFDKKGRLLVADIPGGIGWLRYYDILDDDVVKSLDYIIWQTYELNNDGLDNFFVTGGGSVRNRRPHLFKEVMEKSIITTTFERAVDKPRMKQHQIYKSVSGYQHAGIGAYHIEYDYPGNPDYSYVREAITTMNPPIRN